ncbi:MAG TPA: hypothetical protein DCL72_03290, partial [Rhizobiales bacterium]|nr:hypothetical protein [Hyphomicrobiales bacterium]
MRPFSCAVQRRRRPTPVRISIRPNATFVSHIVSVICAKPSRQISEKSASSHAPASRWDRKSAYIGFIWDDKEHAWEQGFAALIKFKAREGHCRVPTSHIEGKYKLGQWVANTHSRCS